MYVGDDVPNSCLVNWYNDGNEYIGYHTDDETDLVQNKDIYIFSLYDRYNIPRKFKFQSKTTKKITTLELEGGSLLIIPSAVQKTHKHSLPKMKNYPFQRISLTFRYVKEPESYVLK